MEDIKHIQGRFAILDAVLDYEKKGTVLDIYHVFVPEGMRSQGVAEKLTEAAFRFARTEGLRVKPTCSYVRNVFMRKRPELGFLIER